MEELKFQEIIRQIIIDQKKEVLIKHKDFSAFHQAWLKEPHRDEIVGKALKGGDILYYYSPKN